jgi:hypothetical protein
VTDFASASGSRPYPPADLFAGEDEDGGLDFAGRFIPAPELSAWLQSVFVEAAGPLANEDHAHLVDAHLGCLWTNVENVTKRKRIAGTAEIPMPPAASGKWARAMWERQQVDWFGAVPSFRLIFDAHLAMEADHASWCAWCEHELYHCAQGLDEFGDPRWRKDGSPVYAMRGHDAEEFVGVVRRYGPGAAAGGVAELVSAASLPPEIARATIDATCGTCGRRIG